MKNTLQSCPFFQPQLRTMGTLPAPPPTGRGREASVMAFSSSSSASPSPVLEEEQGDRLDALPDSILIHILSFLSTLEAVRTSALSTRWRTLWTSVGALDLDEDNFFFDTGERTIRGSTKRKIKSKRSFVEFVGNVLSFHRTPTLHKLRLNCCSPNLPLKDWICTAVSRAVQMLDFRLRHQIDWPVPMVPSRGVQLPPLLFTSQSLVDLRLDLGGSALILPETMALVGLRRMRLCRVKFCNDHSTRALFSSSTALRSLALENCDYRKLGCLEISCSSLLELNIDSLHTKDGLASCDVTIAAPQLSSFVYLASVAQAYVVEPLLCLDYVKIHFQRFKVRKELDKLAMLERASWFFCSLSTASNLDLCPVCLRAMQFRRTIDPKYPVPFRNLNVLRTAVERLDYTELLLVLRLWLLNPQLRVLVIEVWYLSVLSSSAGKEDFLELLRACFESGINGVLERVEIRCSDDSPCRGYRKVIKYTTETVLELVRVLLGSQEHMKLLLLSNSLFCKIRSPDSRRDAVMEKVLSFPKRTCEVAVAFI